jgi:hypothetical protein
MTRRSAANSWPESLFHSGAVLGEWSLSPVLVIERCRDRPLEPALVAAQVDEPLRKQRHGRLDVLTLRTGDDARVCGTVDI